MKKLFKSLMQSSTGCLMRTLSLLAFVGVSATGCSLMAPQYVPSLENVQTLRDAGDFSTRVAEFSSVPANDNENPLSMRGNSVSSPYNGTYAGYLAEALRQELNVAKKWSTKADTVIGGTVVKNTVDVAGLATGTVDIAVRFTVTQANTVSYDRVKHVHRPFESGFAAATAIPRAIQEYQYAVQQLLGSLYTDREFIDAIQK